MAITKERLQIIIEALNMSRDEMKQLQNDLEGTEAKSKQTKKGLGGMRVSLSALTAIAGSATAAFFALKKAFDLAEQGAQLKLTEKRFGRLAESIGTTASALEEDLGEATRGMLSQFEAMDLATQLMALGLAKNHAEAVRLTSIASQLNMNMNQLVLTLTNRTTMRFDALGVSVDGFKGKVKELEEAGHSTNEAFKLAFMEQSEEQIEKVGSAADTAAGEFKIFRARIKDLRDEAKLWMVEAVEPAISKSNERADVENKLTQALEKGAITQERYNAILRSWQWNSRDAAGTIDYLNEKIDEHGRALLEANPEARRFQKELENSALAAQRMGGKVDEATGIGINALEKFSKQALATTLINQRLEDFSVDKFISPEEVAEIERLGDMLEVDLPENLGEMVENFNILSGDTEGIGDLAPGKLDNIFGTQEAELYITKGGETWAEIEDITSRSQEMILKANPTWDPEFDWFFEGVKLSVKGGGVTFQGQAMKEAIRTMMLE